MSHEEEIDRVIGKTGIKVTWSHIPESMRIDDLPKYLPATKPEDCRCGRAHKKSYPARRWRNHLRRAGREMARVIDKRIIDEILKNSSLVSGSCIDTDSTGSLQG